MRKLKLKNLKFLSILSVILVTVIAFSGCGGPRIPGKYIAEDGSGILTLYDDKTCYLEGKTAFGQASVSGTWKQHDKDIILTFTGTMGQKASVKVTIKEDGVLVDSSGTKWIREDKLKHQTSSNSGIESNMNYPATPEEVVKAYCYATLRGDFKEAMKYAASGQESYVKRDIENAKSVSVKEMKDFHFDPTKNWVTFKIVFTDNREIDSALKVVKENGQWKITYS